MSGFVYLWFDSHRKMYYIGSHWGTEDDGYICSSAWMNRAYKRRPHHFKRRIISWIHTSREDLLIEEQRWMDMIDAKEKKENYYNLSLKSGKRWHTFPDSRKTVSQKISEAKKGKPFVNKGKTYEEIYGPERGALQRQKIAETHHSKKEGYVSPRKDAKQTEEAKQKISESLRSHFKENGAPAQSEETKRKRNESNRGQKRTPEQRKRMSEAHRGKPAAWTLDPIRRAEVAAKISAAKNSKIN